MLLKGGENQCQTNMSSQIMDSGRFALRVVRYAYVPLTA